MENLSRCRLCARVVNGSFKYIYSSDDEGFEEKINTCLPITVTKTDPLPKQICEACLETFSRYQKFYFQVLDAEKILSALWRQAAVSYRNSAQCIDCPLCVEGSITVKDGGILLGIGGENGANDKKSYGHVDNECLTQMIRQELKKEESVHNPCVNKEGDKSKFLFVCFTCGEGFNTEEGVMKHTCLKTCENKEGKPERKIESKKKMEPEKQIDPEKKIEPEKQIEPEKKIEPEKQIEPEKKIEPEKMEPKKKVAPTKRIRFQCETCNKSFAHLKRLKNHRSVCHPSVYYKCDSCVKKFPTKLLLNFHKKKHAEEFPFRCAKCSKTFATNGGLKSHLLLHEKEKLKCNICRANGFYSEQDLNDHIKAKHNSGLGFACDICMKNFLSFSAFFQHRYKHTDIRKYHCNYCTKSFGRWSALQNHIRTHKTEPNLTCEDCEWTFRHACDLKRHKAKQHFKKTVKKLRKQTNQKKATG